MVHLIPNFGNCKDAQVTIRGTRLGNIVTTLNPFGRTRSKLHRRRLAHSKDVVHLNNTYSIFVVSSYYPNNPQGFEHAWRFQNGPYTPIRCIQYRPRPLGALLKSIRHRFSMWLKVPDANCNRRADFTIMIEGASVTTPWSPSLLGYATSSFSRISSLHSLAVVMKCYTGQATAGDPLLTSSLPCGESAFSRVRTLLSNLSLEQSVDIDQVLHLFS